MMDEDDEIQSQPSPTATGSLTASGSPENGRTTVTVAAAAPSLHQSSQTPQQQQQQSSSLTVALPTQQQRNGGGGGGGREDCWSEGGTAVLIDAWGERYLELSRGNLKQKHWKEVADIVSSRDDYRKNPKTDIQCKNRIDTVKKKYKLEKTKIMSGEGSSKWVFFEKLDQLIGPTAAKIPAVAATGAGGSSRVPMGIPVGTRNQIVVAKHQNQHYHHQGGGGGGGSSSGQKIQFRKRGGGAAAMAAVDSEEERSDEEESMDNFPPDKKRGRVAVMGNLSKGKKEKEKENGGGGWGDSVRMLTQAILKFGEAYERAESEKMQQVKEMENQRMKFAKDLDAQRMNFFMKTQTEILELKHGKRTGGNASRRRHHLHHRTNDNGNNNNNNSDSDN